MTERERLAADVRRLAWLADAALGPARSAYAAPTIAPERRPALPIGSWRRGPAAARGLGQRIRRLRSELGLATPERALESIR